jgi:hypothetical protein
MKEPIEKKGIATSKEVATGLPEGRASHKEPITKNGDLTMEATNYAGFDMKTVSENVLKAVKFSLDTTFDNVSKVQDFNDKIVKEMISANKQIQAGTEKMMGEWFVNGKKGLDEYRKVVEEGYKRFEELLTTQK